MKKILKTVNWADCHPLLEGLACFETGVKPKNFTEYLSVSGCLPYSSLSQSCDFIENFLLNKKFEDVTQTVVDAEDKCLFAKDSNEATVVNIVLDVLHSLYSGGKLPSLWCYLDDEKKAIVHLVEHHGYYAEIYCEAKENSSAVHLIETDKGKVFLPAIFVQDLTSYAKQVELRGGICLRDYPPREKFDFLSNKSGLKTRRLGKEKTQTGTSKKHLHDNGDCL